MTGQQWEYLQLSAPTGANSMTRLDQDMNDAGAAGFELVGWASADKTIGFTGWVAIFKRSGVRRDSPEGKKAADPAWLPDPYERHEQRYWEGRYWTELVSNAGEQSIDVPR